MPVVSLRHAGAADRPALERLWLMFRHAMSEFGGQLPNRTERSGASAWRRRSRVRTGPRI